MKHRSVLPPVMQQQPTAYLAPWQSQPEQQQQTAPPEPATAPPGSTVTVPAPPPPPAAPAVRTFTEEDIERARQQEKDKLYPTIEELKNNLAQQGQTLAEWQAERAQREADEQAARDAATAAEEEKRRQESDFKTLLEEERAARQKMQEDFTAQIATRDALLQKEREFAELQGYIHRRVDEERDSILPELVPNVMGNTPEEVEQALSVAKAQSASILQNVAAAQQQQVEQLGLAHMQQRGVGVTAPPVGPMDTDSGYQTLTADQIQAMDMKTFAENRGRLLGAAANPQSGRGMFG